MIIKPRPCTRQMEYAKYVGTKVRLARKKTGLSIKAIAAIADLKPDTICDIETGKRSTQITTLKLIADALGVSVKQFV